MKYKTEICDDEMTFQECEMAIVRHAVDEMDAIRGQKIANSEEVKKIMEIVERFIIDKKLICYGGTAINNILPKNAQFYNKDAEIPDYDFYSWNALEHAKELANIYHKAGYEEIEAKSGMHVGTFKVFVNFIPVADITFIHKSLFKSIQKEAITIAGIKYSPPNLLRMNMYLELSRPAGDVSRWEKVLKRLTLLNEYYPMKPVLNCNAVDFQRKMETNVEDSEKIYFIVRDSFIEQGVIFFGGYASSLYSKYMNKTHRRLVQKIPDFDVLSEEPEKCAMIVKERMTDAGFQVKTVHHAAIGEIIPESIELKVGVESVAFIYKPIACHNYNTIDMGDKSVNVATIDTILSFYFAFYYSDKPYYNKDRALCMSKFLFDVEQQNRLEQKGVLKRFSINCYGKQETIEDMRTEKTEKFKELMNDKTNPEYEEWFMKYNPADFLPKSTSASPYKSKTMSKSKTISKSKTMSKSKKKRRKTKRVHFFR